MNDVARAASQVQTLAEKNQHQAQIERDALRVVGLAQARFNAGIIAGSRVSEARIPALRERANGLLLQGQCWMPPFNSLVRWAGVTNADDMRLLYLTFIQR